jgi:hypothetical protein
MYKRGLDDKQKWFWTTQNRSISGLTWFLGGIERIHNKQHKNKQQR